MQVHRTSPAYKIYKRNDYHKRGLHKIPEVRVVEDEFISPLIP